jgi:hypothetical protein
MNKEDKEAALTRQYSEWRDQLTRVLYERDPYAMGASIGAPEDEYAPIAERLMPRLSRATTRAECASILEDNEMHDSLLVGEVWAIFGGAIEE